MDIDQELRQYKWDDLRDIFPTLKHTLGFSGNVEFLGYLVQDDGIILSITPKEPRHPSEPVRETQRCNEIYRLLYFYAQSEEIDVPRNNETLTKVAQLRDGSLACSTNQHRMEAQFQAMFDENPNLLESILKDNFYAESANHGDTSYRVPLLPRLPLWIVYYEAEEEDGLPSDVKLFFEAHAKNYLPAILLENIENLLLEQVTRLFRD